MHKKAGFLKITLKALNIPFEKVVMPGRVKCGGSWLSEKKLIWQGMGNSGGS